MPERHENTPRSSVSGVALAAGLALPLLGFMCAVLASIKPLDPLQRHSSPLGNTCPAGTVRCTWENTYGGPLEDKAYGVAALDDGGLVVAGHSRSRPGFTYAGRVLRLGRSGDLRWERWVESGRHDRGFGVTATPSGGIVAAGRTHKQRGRGHDGWVFRLSPRGSILWQRTYGGAGDDRLRAIAPTPGEDVVAGGYRTSGRQRQGWILRVAEDGTLAWEWSRGGAEDRAIHDVATLRDGSIIGVGHAQVKGFRGYALWVVRLRADGGLVWEKTFRRQRFDAGTAVVASDNGLLFIAAQSGSRISDTDAWILALDGDGKRVWQRVLGGPKNDNPWSIAEGAEGGAVIAVASASGRLGGTDAWIVGLDEQGGTAWERRHGHELWDRPAAIARAAPSGYLVAGETTSLGAGYEDYWVLRLDDRGGLP